MVNDLMETFKKAEKLRREINTFTDKKDRMTIEIELLQDRITAREKMLEEIEKEEKANAEKEFQKDTLKNDSYRKQIKDIILELQKILTTRTIPLENIKLKANERGIDEELTDDIIQAMKRRGDIYSPKHGFISLLVDEE